MPHPDNLQAELRAAIVERRAVIVVGTGISIAASRDPNSEESHPQASWAGLLESGLQWLEEHKLISETTAYAHRILLKEDPDAQTYISAAGHIIRHMGGDCSMHFEKWLHETIGAIVLHDRAAIDALHSLREHGNLLATTNYDSLLLDKDGVLEPVSWNEPNGFIRAIRKRDVNSVLFLHGHWRKSQSVILDWSSYERICEDDPYREDLTVLWRTATWVYVGCGAYGLSDPDFGLLMKRYGERARQADHWDYCLVRSEQREEFQAHFDKKRMNVRAISFGDRHEDLPNYLRSLLPAPALTPKPAPPIHAGLGESNPIPKPPALYAKPDYIGSHQFVGRTRELEELNDWAKAADRTNLLLFEAIGGNGKSMLTWEWITKHATRVRGDWAGRFWYSFYTQGASMADFCQRALAYMTEKPFSEFREKKVVELTEPLLAELHAKPWLLVLDGLESVLVAYDRVDAAEMDGEDAGNLTDMIVDRSPCDAIRDEDGELLRKLAAASPSQILISSRLMPLKLLNDAGQPISGVKRSPLSGLRPTDGEQLLRSCGVEGDSVAIQDYLTANCDNHPLVIGALGGLIRREYLPAGDFDTWVVDPGGGAKLDLGSLDLVCSQNHILFVAIDALPPASHHLLSTLALLSDPIDCKTLNDLNPHLPPEPEEVKEPEAPESYSRWGKLSDKNKAKRRSQYEADLSSWRDYQIAMRVRLESAEYREAPGKLADTVADLEQRGLLQYDGHLRRYSLHPVVRAVVAGGMELGDKQIYGRRVVDYFTSLPSNSYEHAETLDDLRQGLNAIRTLLKLGYFDQAANAFLGDFANAILHNIEAPAEVLSLLRPFFPDGWGRLPSGVTHASSLINCAAMALDDCGKYEDALAAYGVALNCAIEKRDWRQLVLRLGNTSHIFSHQNKLARSYRTNNLALDLAMHGCKQEEEFTRRLVAYSNESELGRFEAADHMWIRLDPMGRKWNRNVYRPGSAEYQFARSQRLRGVLREEHLANAEYIAKEGKNRSIVRHLHNLRGFWRLDQKEWALAAASFSEASNMASESGVSDAASETGLALAKFSLGQLAEPQREARRLAWSRLPAHRLLAQLWLALGDGEQAKHHALAAYRWAWADGEPYVHRYALTKSTELLVQMDVPVPELAPYDPAKDEPFPWEADVRAAIAKLRKENEANGDNDTDGSGGLRLP